VRVDKRRSVRRPVRYTAWIAERGKELQGCVLADISDTGARLNVPEPAKLPDEFFLCLSTQGSARRRCSVAWRSKAQVGVRFDTPLAPKVRNDALAKMLAAKREEYADRKTARTTRSVEPA
jgi:hypothetical protein